MESSDASTLLMTVNVTFNVPLLTVVLAVLATTLLYAGIIRYRRYRVERQVEATVRLIVDYFQKHGFEVVARCFSILGGQRFIAAIESPPLKRFRYSHIIESSMILHLQQTAGVTVDRVFWRFPLVWQGSEALPTAGKIVEEDPISPSTRRDCNRPSVAIRLRMSRGRATNRASLKTKMRNPEPIAISG